MAFPYMSPFKPSVLQGRKALITGGGSGIGFEIARQLGLHGCKIAIMGRRQKVLDEGIQALAADGIEAVAVQGDVRNEDDAVKAVELARSKFGGLDTLINGAAGNFLANAAELAPKGFKTVMEIDTVGTFTMCRASFQSLQESKQGVIINISATLQLPATWYQVHASAAKAAIDSMTRSLALEWGSHQIRVNGIAPGPIADTPGMSKLAGPGAADAIRETIEPMIPLGRLGSKFDIAMAAVFLCSGAASYVSGDTLLVDGASYLYREQLLPPEVVAEFSRKMEKKAKGQAPAQSKL